jgi:hypothetical protein
VYEKVEGRGDGGEVGGHPTCHHSRPWRAEYSKAWWLLCQPSPKARRPTHLRHEKGGRQNQRELREVPRPAWWLLCQPSPVVA